MTVQIKYKSNIVQKNLTNLVLFVDEKYNILKLRKHLSSYEYSYISDLLKAKDLKKKIASFDLNSKKKIILISLEDTYKSSDIENLGAKFYDQLKDFNEKSVLFMSVNKARFRKPILPNQNIRFEVSFLNTVRDVYKFKGSAFFEDTKVAETEFTAMITIGKK